MTDSIKLELPLNAVNLILQSLGKQPFEVVADVVQAIREQAIPQIPVPQDVQPELQSELQSGA